MSDWTKNHPDIPEPQLSDLGTYASASITANGVSIEVRFETKEAAYRFYDAYANAISVQVSDGGRA